MKRKKLWITLISIVGAFLVIVVSLGLLTKLSVVSVEFRSRVTDGTKLESGILDKVKESGEFNYSKSVLFMDVNKNAEKIEKSNPYVKVEQIIRKFPNRVNVYISERIPKYRVKETESGIKWYILDEDFKVLQTTTDLEGDHFLDTTVEISYFVCNAEIGDFVDRPADKTNLNSILSGVYGKTRDYFAARVIDYDSETSTFSITMKSSGSVNYQDGCVIKIIGSKNLRIKAFEATSVYIDEFGQLEDKGVDLTKKVIIVSDDDDYGRIIDQE